MFNDERRSEGATSNIVAYLKQGVSLEIRHPAVITLADLRSCTVKNGKPTSGPLRELYTTFVAGEINRRAFVEAAASLGIGAAGVAFLAQTGAAAQAATAVADAVPMTRSEIGTENQERGAGGELKLIQWQAATLLSPHVATGTKDYLGAILVVEPLMHYLPDASIIPNLLEAVPSVENGMLAEDLSSVTLKLLPDLLWSDGEPVTADDVKFTIEWVQNPENASTNLQSYSPITAVEVVDELTTKVTFNGPNPFWFDPFTGTSTGFLYPKHALESGPDAHTAYLSNPIGTGPYKVESFTPGDQGTFVINEHYREPNKPFFSRVILKGGGDAAAAARSVLQTGDFHFAWKMQVEPDVLAKMEGPDARGTLVPYPGVNIERINVQFADPNTEVDGQKAEVNTPHPFWSDKAVREAMTYAIDRQTIADRFYGNGQNPAANIVTGDAAVESPNTSWEFNPEKAKQILDDAGWTMQGDVRAKDGVELKVVLATSVNAVRQKTQAVVKQGMDAVGFNVELLQIDAGIFFDGAAGNDSNINHFYWDLCMYQSVPNSPRPISLMENWYAGKDNENVAQAANQWSGQNFNRFVNAEYDAAFDAAKVETDADKLAEEFITMNDIVINDVAIVPLVVAGEPRAVSNKLNVENIALAAFSYDYWNVANWNFVDGAEG